MSAQLIFDTAPLGAIIRYSDGTLRPPERHRRKLQAWERHNNTGRLVKRQAGARVGETIIPGSFTLHEGDYGTKAVIVLKNSQEASEQLADAIKAHVKAKLAPFKYPRWIEFVAELPKTATGKIQRFRLRKVD